MANYCLLKFNPRESTPYLLYSGSNLLSARTLLDEEVRICNNECDIVNKLHKEKVLYLVDSVKSYPDRTDILYYYSHNGYCHLVKNTCSLLLLRN